MVEISGAVMGFFTADRDESRGMEYIPMVLAGITRLRACERLVQEPVRGGDDPARRLPFVVRNQN
jgi:hypothetical protein